MSSAHSLVAERPSLSQFSYSAHIRGFHGGDLAEHNWAMKFFRQTFPAARLRLMHRFFHRAIDSGSAASGGDRHLRVLAWRGFSLVELLVVIAIVAVLLGLLLPAVQAVRESARRTTCSNNLRNLSMGMLAHHESEGAFPYGFNWLEAFWHGPLLPYIEQQPLFDTLVYDEHKG